MCPYARPLIGRRGVNWASAGDEGEEVTIAAANLHGRKWPARFSVDSYNEYYNSVVSDATAVMQNPMDDTATSIILRQSWWARIAMPPTGSAFHAAAARARVITQQRQTTVAHRDAFKAAMVKEIAAWIAASG